MDKAVIYIHGKGGNAEEAIHYKPLFSNCDVIGLDYTAQFPWEAKEEFPLLFNSIYRNYKTVEVIANSIGAYFAINALSNQQIEKAYFISPVVDMERLIADMMIWANVTEDELKEKKEIQTTFGETLSWDYLCYARENPIIWEIPTHILYGEKDNLTAYGTIFEFVQRTNSTLSIMKNGEHWFHTDETDSFIQLEQTVSYGWNDEFHTVETFNKKDTYRSAHQSAVNARPISANKSSIFSRPTERRIVFWLISILCLCSSVKVP